MALSSIPSSSSSSNTCQFKHDVFLSFRGEDTRYSFTSHLHKALHNKQIETFVDYDLNRGDEIFPSLLKAIEESRISIIIFSKDYASSRWRLEELEKIVECRQNHRQIVIPVFYGIDPSHVRNQSGNFAVAFAKHQQCTQIVSLCRGQRWKDALKEVANLSGFDSGFYKNECELIEAIVQHVSKRLNDQLPSTDTCSHLVGIHSRIKHIESLLSYFFSEDVCIRGIRGIGGIGKTTLDREVFKNEEIEHRCGLELWPESALESDHGGNTDLHRACDLGNLDSVRQVIVCNPQLCLMKNKDKRILLHIAVMRGRVDLVRELLRACPKSIEELTSEERTVHLASDQGNLDVVREVIECNPQLCLMKNKDEIIPLHIGVIRGRVDLVRELLIGPESVMLVSAKEETPLHAAIRQWQEFFLEPWIENIQKRRDYVPLINKKDCAGNRQQFHTIRLLPSDRPSCNGKVDVNALRARDSGKVKLDFSDNVKWIESQRNKDQSSYLQANWPMKTKHNTPRDACHVLLITAAVILAITFYAALIAPGKLVDNIKYKSSSSLGFQVGKQSSNYLLRLFIWFDSIAFITSAASMIIILLHEIPLKPWMLISVLSIYGAYICLIIAVSPRDALPVFLLGSPTILLASMSKHLALHSTLLKLLQFLWFTVKSGDQEIAAQMLQECPEYALDLIMKETSPGALAGPYSRKRRLWWYGFAPCCIKKTSQIIKLLLTERFSCKAEVEVNPMNDYVFTTLDNLHVLRQVGKRDMEISEIIRIEEAIKTNNFGKVILDCRTTIAVLNRREFGTNRRIYKLRGVYSISCFVCDSASVYSINLLCSIWLFPCKQAG